MINRIAGSAALVLTLAVGGLTFLFGYQYQLGALQNEAMLQARLLSEALTVRKGPPSLADLLPEFKRIRQQGGEAFGELLSPRGEVVTHLGHMPPFPRIEQHVPILQDSEVVATLRLTRSIRPLLLISGMMLLPGAFLGFLLYHLLRLYPLRTLHFALQEIAERRQAEDRLQQSLSFCLLPPWNPRPMASWSRMPKAGWWLATNACRPCGSCLGPLEKWRAMRPGL